RDRARDTRVPEISRYLAWSVLPCSTWPVHVDHAPGPVRAAGAAPILVIGTTHDPATPYAWARSLARQLDSGVLLTREGDGHTAIATESRCVSRAIAAYLLSDWPPEPGTVCR
ncbi:MAG: alpha/beta hydrolase, partial [Actinomycetota bacterium]